MLTAHQAKKKEQTLLTSFVRFYDTLAVLGQQRQIGKKIIEQIIDMNTQKLVLADRMEQLQEESDIQLYRSTIGRVEQLSVKQLASLASVLGKMVDCIQNLKKIEEAVVITCHTGDTAIEFDCQSQSELRYLQTVNTLVSLTVTGSKGYQRHLSTLHKTVSECQKLVFTQGAETSRYKYGLLLWIYEPYVEQDLSATYQNQLAELHKCRSTLIALPKA